MPSWPLSAQIRVKDKPQTNNVAAHAASNYVLVEMMLLGTNSTQLISVGDLVSNTLPSLLNFTGNTATNNTTTNDTKFGLFDQLSAGVFRYFGLEQGSNVVLYRNGSNIVVNSTSTGGEVTTAQLNASSNAVLVASGRILYVRTNGTDATAIAGDERFAWRNVSNAVKTAVSGDTIDIGSGFHWEPTNSMSLLKSNVNWIVPLGTTLAFGTTADGANPYPVFHDWDGPVRCTFFGGGTFLVSNQLSQVFHLTNALSKVTVFFGDQLRQLGQVGAIVQGESDLTFIGTGDIISDGYDAYINEAGGEPGPLFIFCRDILGDDDLGDSSLEFGRAYATPGKATVIARRARGDLTLTDNVLLDLKAVDLGSVNTIYSTTHSTNGSGILRGATIYGSSNASMSRIDVPTTPAGVFRTAGTFEFCTIWGPTNLATVTVTNSGGARLTFRNCVFKDGWGGTNSIRAETSPQTVYFSDTEFGLGLHSSIVPGALTNSFHTLRAYSNIVASGSGTFSNGLLIVGATEATGDLNVTGQLNASGPTIATEVLVNSLVLGLATAPAVAAINANNELTNATLTSDFAVSATTLSLAAPILTNVNRLSLSNATMKPVARGVGNRMIDMFGLEQGANITLTPNGSNLVVAANRASIWRNGGTNLQWRLVKTITLTNVVDVSAAAYYPSNGTLWTTHNNNNGRLTEWTLDGIFVRKLDWGASTITDCETVHYMGGNTFALVEEDSNRIHIFNLTNNATGSTLSTNNTTIIQLATSIGVDGSGSGVEGIAYDWDRKGWWIAKEKAPAQLLFVSSDGATTNNWFTTAQMQNFTNANNTDFSDLFLDRENQVLLVAQDEGGQFDRILAIDLITSNVLFTVACTNFGQLEGVSLTPDGKLLVAGEANQFAIFEPVLGGLNTGISWNNFETGTNGPALPIFPQGNRTAGQTNSGSLNVAGGVTNWAAVHNKLTSTNEGAVKLGSTLEVANVATVANATVTANIADGYKTTSPNRALTATNTSGAAAWRPAIPSGLRFRRASWAGLYNSSMLAWEQFGENIASSASPTMQVATTNAPARATLTTGATTNAIVGIQPQNILRTVYFPGKNTYWSWAGRFDTTNSGYKYFAGLNSESSVLGTVATNDSHATRHSAMFRSSTTAADTTWKFITSDGSTQTTTDTTVLCDTNRLIFEIIEDSANLTWYGYINGVVRATNTANLPAAALNTWVTADNITNANARTIYHEGIYSEQDHR